MDRVEVLEKLEPISHVKVKPVTHDMRTKVMVQPTQVVIRPGSGGALVPMSENGVKAMANFIGMPMNICRDLSPATFGTVATELLARKERYNLLIDNDMVQNFGSYEGVANLPVEKVLKIIEQAIRNADYHKVHLMSNRSVSLEVVGAKETPVRRGDLVRAGAFVSFSPISTIRPQVQAFVLRCRCTNGQTDKTVLAEFTGGRGEGDDVWQWFRQSVRAAYQSVGPIVNRYRDMLKERIAPEQRAVILEELLRSAGITGKEAEAVRAQAIMEPPRNNYEMLNLITWASSHIIRKPEKIQRALATAATFTSESEHATICPLCRTRHVPRQITQNAA